MTSEEPDPKTSKTSKDELNGSQENASELSEQTVPSTFLPVYRVRMKFHTLPLLISIIISGVIAWLIYSTPWFETPIQEENPGQGLVNGLVYTAFAVVSSVIIYFLVKKRGANILRIIMSIAFMFLTFTLLFFFGLFILPVNIPDVWDYVYIVLCGILALVLTYLFFADKMPRIPKNLYVLAIGTFIGAFMAIVMPMWTTIVLLVGVSIWDIISVKRGPIKGIMEIMGHINPDEIRNLTREDFNQAEIQIGIGDIAFYSMLTSGTLVSASSFTFSKTSIVPGIQLTLLGSILVTIFAAIGILVGAFITIQALRRNAILPGLPLSILIGLGFAVLSYIVLINIRFFYIYVP